MVLSGEGGISAPQKIYRVGIAPKHAPKEFIEHKIVLAGSLQEAIDKMVRFAPDFLAIQEIRQVVLVDVVDIA